MDTQGRHLIVEMSGCDEYLLGSKPYVALQMKLAAIEANATIVASAFHQFTPTGVSGVVVVAESHLSIHTWPERGYAALDFYTCGNIDPQVAMDYMFKRLCAESMQVVEVKRGLPTAIDADVFTSQVK